MIKYSIISPIHNEEAVLSELVSRVDKVMKRYAKNDWEFLLIDDVSSDSTSMIIKKLVKAYPLLKSIRHKTRGGQAGCFKTAFRNAKGPIIVTLDGDLQVMPEDIPLFLDKMKEGYDIVNGIREHRKHPFWIRLASRIYNLLMLIFFDSPVLDAASNYMAVKSKYVKNLSLRGNDHRYIVPIVMQRGAKRIGEVIVEHKGRKTGKSKYKALPKYIRGGPEIIFAWLRFKFGYFR
ncbi:glycosyltransferase [Candidatus Woesearchaeota archaeon]|nr:glycosyltransferase [Candidatus Woesearchaeota archaeon]